MALLDLGFKPPKSTGGMCSPDGIYGTETEAAIKEFLEATTALNPDGRVGRDTMAAFDKLFAGPTRRVRLHRRCWR